MGTPYPYPECKVNNALGNITEIILDIVAQVSPTYSGYFTKTKMMFSAQTSSRTGSSTRCMTNDHAFSLKGDHFPSTKKKIYMNLYLFQVQNNGSSANLMPHDIADLGGWWRNLKLITVGNVKVLIKVTAPPQTSTWTKK